MLPIYSVFKLNRFTGEKSLLIDGMGAEEALTFAKEARNRYPLPERFSDGTWQGFDIWVEEDTSPSPLDADGGPTCESCAGLGRMCAHCERLAEETSAECHCEPGKTCRGCQQAIAEGNDPAWRPSNHSERLAEEARQEAEEERGRQCAFLGCDASPDGRFGEVYFCAAHLLLNCQAHLARNEDADAAQFMAASVPE